MSDRLAARYAEGAIWWRGSGPDWIYWLPEQAERLRDLFAAEPNPYAAPLARDLTNAIEAFKADHP